MLFCTFGFSVTEIFPINNYLKANQNASAITATLGALQKSLYQEAFCLSLPQKSMLLATFRLTFSTGRLLGSGKSACTAAKLSIDDLMFHSFI